MLIDCYNTRTRWLVVVEVKNDDCLWKYSRFGHLSTKASIWPQRSLKGVLEPGKTEMRCVHPTSDISSIFRRSEKSVFSTIFLPVLRVFLRFTCQNGGFWVHFINIGRKKTTSTWHLILKVLQWFSFDLKLQIRC